MKTKPLIILLFLVACKSKIETIKPTVQSITESVYASGIIKSSNQYRAFATVNGIIENIYVTEGDSVTKGSPILSIANDAQRINKETAVLAARFNDFNNNQDKLNDALQLLSVVKSKLKNDSSLFFKQKKLWEQKVGTEIDFEARQLAYENSKAAFYSANVKYNDLKKQLDFSSSQSKKNLQLTSKLENDFTVKSQINGRVYSIDKVVGDLIGPQTSLAVIGDANNFVLEMQVDEYDILKIKKGLLVLVTLDSYKGKTFEAVVSKIDPMMNERSKTFLVEATFTKHPPVLYPFITFEANIVLNKKDNVILIPRNYIMNDSLVIKKNGDTVIVKTGSKDYQKIEILSGISADVELQKPKE